MMKLLAGAFAGFAAMFGGMFGGHATSTPMHGPMDMGSTSPMHMASSTSMRGMGMMGGMGVFGKVTAVNGSSLTVEGHGGSQGMATTTFTVDASNATVMKNNATSTISDVAVGDTVMVSGTVSGTTVTAKMIMDGLMNAMMHGGMHMGGGMMMGHTASSTAGHAYGKPPVAPQQ